jgi:hypothetical protein
VTAPEPRPKGKPHQPRPVNDQLRSDLTTLGFKSYGAYIRSALHGAIKASAFAKSRKCVKCGAKATWTHFSVHSLETLKGDKPEAVHPVCVGCMNQARFVPGTREFTTLGQRNEFYGIGGG